MLSPLQAALRDAKGDEAELWVHRRRSAITRYAKNEIHQNAVADDWELHGFLSCAKGEPLQLMRVGHGAAHARFRDVPIEVRE